MTSPRNTGPISQRCAGGRASGQTEANINTFNPAENAPQCVNLFLIRSSRHRDLPVKVISIMTSASPSYVELDGAEDERRAALAYVTEAFAEAILAGIESESFAHAALFAALQELVETYGEEAVSAFAGRLPSRIEAGEFTVAIKH